jgi:hypothetical protein
MMTNKVVSWLASVVWTLHFLKEKVKWMTLFEVNHLLALAETAAKMDVCSTNELSLNNPNRFEYLRVEFRN